MFSHFIVVLAVLLALASAFQPISQHARSFGFALDAKKSVGSLTDADLKGKR